MEYYIKHNLLILIPHSYANYLSLLSSFFFSHLLLSSHSLSINTNNNQVRTRGSGSYGERQGGLDIYPDENGHYHLLEEGTNFLLIVI